MRINDHTLVAEAGGSAERRAQIAALEAHMLAMDDGDKLDIEAVTFHHFASGVYCREMRLPAGYVLVGKIHKTENMSVLLQGHIRVTTETGTTELHAPQIMVSAPGTKRVGYAITDTIWLSLHAVGNERDLCAIEERFIASSFDDFDKIAAQQGPLEVEP